MSAFLRSLSLMSWSLLKTYSCKKILERELWSFASPDEAMTLFSPYLHFWIDLAMYSPESMTVSVLVMVMAPSAQKCRLKKKTISSRPVSLSQAEKMERP